VSPLRVGLAGCGRLAEIAYLPALVSLSGLSLVAVADPDAGRRELAVGLALRLGEKRPTAYRETGEMLERAALDGLVLATPAVAHPADAAAAAEAGVAALVEKPPAADAEGAQRIASLAPAAWIGFNRRFGPLAGMRDRLMPGEHTDLHLELQYRRESWGSVTVRDDALIDLAPHLADLALWLAAATPVEVRTVWLTPRRARLELKTTNGRALIACATDRPHRERAEAFAADGRRLWSWRTGGLAHNALARLRRGEHGLVASIRAQLAAYEAVLRGGSPGALARASDGLEAMRVVDAARESWGRGGAVVSLAAAVGTGA